MQVIGTAGHVDHGKSTLVTALTGIDPDRFEEEKRRGLTIDLGFAWLLLPSGREIGVIDVPGHERFIKNMLAGAGGMTICLFVVDAGEGWKPQSSEHLAILHLLDIRAGVVALTKADAADHQTLAATRAQVAGYLAGTGLAGASMVAVSARDGSGLPELVSALDDLVGRTPPPLDPGRPRLWVDRVFTIAGAGTVVTGTLAGGSLSVADEVAVEPEGRRARVRAIQTHRKEVGTIEAGNRVALNLAGLDRRGATRGHAVVRPGQWRSTRAFDARVEVLSAELAGVDYELSGRGSHLLYIGSAETSVRVRLTGAMRVAPGEHGFARLHTAVALPLARGDRFVLRDAGRGLTFGGGVVLDPLPRSPRPDRRLLDALNGADAQTSLRELVHSEGAVDRAEALLRTGTDHAGGIRALGTQLVSQERTEELRRSLMDLVAEHHAGSPLQRGLDREALRVRLGLDARSLQALLEQSPEVVEEGALVRMADFAVKFPPEQEAERSRIIAALEATAYSPPSAAELRADAALLRALVEAGDLVPVKDFFLTFEQARRARTTVRTTIENEGPVTIARIRDVLGTSRKYAVPLCEWLDATGATRRRGDLRVLGPRA